MTGMNEIEQFHFTEEHIELIRKYGKPIEMQKNQILIKEGQVPDCCYYIESGQVISYEYNNAGTERIFATNEPGSVILVPSMVITHAVTLNFKSSKPSRLIAVPKEAMYQAIADHPELGADFIYSLSARLISTIESFRERGNYSVPYRVCSKLLHYAEHSGIDYDGKILIQEKVSQQNIANSIQANRVTVARAIRELKDLGLVEYINGYYCIRSVEQLKKHMTYIEN